ncbi:MAG: hypothetical protein M1838_003096 [Thelocarpon superellum]|nr:MAG: hypothetical protein M1838_003096 [Thelocarpon superellum]
MMPSTHGSVAASSSPHSKGQLDSHPSSPETKVTAFSPELPRTSKDHDGLSNSTHGPPVFALDAGHYQLPSYLKSPELPKSSSVPTNGHLTLTPSFPHDPFVTTLSSKLTATHPPEQKLSPTASSFTPLTASSPSPWSASYGPFTNASSRSTPSALDFHAVPDHDGGGTHLKSYLKNVSMISTPLSQTTQRPVGAHFETPGARPSNSPLGSAALAIDGKIVRALVIKDIAKDTPSQLLKEHFNAHLFPSLKGPLFVDLVGSGVIYLGFASIHDCEAAVLKARTHRPDWSVEYLPAAQFAQKLNLLQESGDEGGCRVLVKARFLGPSDAFDVGGMEQLLPELLANYGDVHDLQLINVHEPGLLCVFTVFSSKTAAQGAAQALNGFKIQGCQLTVSCCEADLENVSPIARGTLAGTLSEQRPETVLSQRGSGLEEVMGAMTLTPYRGQGEAPYGQYVKGPGLSRLSPTGRSALGFDAAPIQWNGAYAGPEPLTPRHRDRPAFFPTPFHGGRYHEDGFYAGNGAARDVHGAIGQERGQLRPSFFPPDRYSPNRRSAMRVGGRHDHEHTSGHHNVVDVGRIRHGLDIMLRNIPNKIDQAMLKEIVDDTSAGKYDFMYLRIDFANNCNVGYAFINFEDPYFIIDFVEARAGLRWNRFNSDKVAEVSYATIQGKDCLVQKFRNSSVMLEHPSFRPKIFHTGTGPLAGQEDTFPGPDNPSKMRRSVENAEHVGLFAPRAGQHNRDEQRRRRSQYDRGTRLAEMDEAYEYQRREEEAYYRDLAFRTVQGDRFPRRPGPARYEPSY